MQRQTFKTLFQRCHQLNTKGCEWLLCSFSWWIYLLFGRKKVKKTKCSDTTLVSNPARYLVCCHTNRQAGRRLALVVERASHVQRRCPCCSGPGLESLPGILCCVSLPLSHSFSCLLLSCSMSNSLKGPPKKVYIKKPKYTSKEKLLIVTF